MSDIDLSTTELKASYGIGMQMGQRRVFKVAVEMRRGAGGHTVNAGVFVSVEIAFDPVIEAQ
ncbi:MAG: hypothetical protein ACPG3T_06455, partial [Pseudomonadales bacterium]